jgi:predicted permease
MPTLNGAEDAEVVLPLPMAPNAAQIRGREDYNILAKLKPGVSVEAAQSEMDALTASLRVEHPDVYPPNGGLTFRIVPLREQVVGHARRSIVVLIGAVGCLLLVACANVANLLLSRALVRSKEIALRVVLGAGTARILRHLLLALAGGAAGLLLSHLGVRAIQSLGAESVPRASAIAIDAEVLLFTLLVSTASGLLFGLVPALRVSRLDLNDQLKSVSRSASAGSAVWGRGGNLRRVLVAAELALSVMLLIGAGLLVRSFARLQEVHPGFNAAHTMTVELTLSGREYTDVAVMLEAYRDLWARLGRIPGVTAAGGVSALPLSQMMSWGPVTVEGRIPPPGEKFVNVDQRIVAGDYFRAMEIPLLGGRAFTEQDTRANPRVAIVDSHMARQLWPGQDPVGKRLKLGALDSNSPWVTVVGIVGRIRQDGLDAESRIAIYVPQTQYPTRAMNAVVRSRGDAASLTPAIREQIRELDPDLPMYGVRTMDERVDASLARRRFSMLLLTLFAVLALGIASVGVYGVISYLVTQGVREIGIRLALGATPRRILGMVVQHGMRVALTGVASGLAGALLLTRFMRGLLFGVGERDPLTFVATPVVLAAVALAATYIPARRAARIDPIESLRRE